MAAPSAPSRRSRRRSTSTSPTACPTTTRAGPACWPGSRPSTPRRTTSSPPPSRSGSRSRCDGSMRASRRGRVGCALLVVACAAAMAGRGSTPTSAATPPATPSRGTRSSFPAPNLSTAERRRFEVGDSFFTKNWVTAPASTDARDGLGPTFNAQACSSCHVLDGAGRSAGSGRHRCSTRLAAAAVRARRDADGRAGRASRVRRSAGGPGDPRRAGRRSSRRRPWRRSAATYGDGRRTS